MFELHNAPRPHDTSARGGTNTLKSSKGENVNNCCLDNLLDTITTILSSGEPISPPKKKKKPQEPQPKLADNSVIVNPPATPVLTPKLQLLQRAIIEQVQLLLRNMKGALLIN